MTAAANRQRCAAAHIARLVAFLMLVLLAAFTGVILALVLLLHSHEPCQRPGCTTPIIYFPDVRDA